MKGTWEVEWFCNTEAEVILELVSGINEMVGDLGG